MSIELIPYSQGNAELVLSWRNCQEVRLNSIDDAFISSDAHAIFLSSLLNDERRRYFVVSLCGQPTAAINFSGLDGSEVAWGCLIAPGVIVPGLFPSLLAIAIDYSFAHSRVISLVSEVATHNKAPISLNRFVGIDSLSKTIRQTKSGRLIEFQKFQLLRDRRHLAVAKINRLLTGKMREMTEKYVIRETLRSS